MFSIGNRRLWTRRLLRHHVEAIGIEAGDQIMAHAALRKVGPMLNGPDALIGAILDVAGPTGTLLCYVNWDEQYSHAVDNQGCVPDALKPEIPPFDMQTSRASRHHGAFAEFVRTTPGALRSRNPGASFAAIGHRAGWFVADHPLNYGYGGGSPFAKLVEARGKVLMIGAPHDSMSILHHAEHLAQIPGKHVVRMETPFRVGDGVEWRTIEEFDTSEPVVDGLPPDYFGMIMDQFLATGRGTQAVIGSAPSTLVPAADIVDFAVRWLEKRFR
ncbi:MAG TPA: aminoglycoside 3-N-acetyltransferase [Bryobacteraceae bacterium]